MTEKDPLLVFPCDVCGRRIEDRHHSHRFHVLETYGGITCCDTCWDSNSDGWSPQLEAVLMGHLMKSGLSEPERNGQGLLPRS